MLAAGDAISPLKDPVLDWFGGGWLGGRADSQEKLLKLTDEKTRIVPSYGPVVGRAELQAEFDMTRTLFDRMLDLVKKGMSAQDMLDAGPMKDLPRTFRDPFKFAYDAHKGYWAHHNSLVTGIAPMDTVMKRAVFAVIFSLAAAGTAAAADDTLAGLIQAGQSRRRAHEDRRGRRCERSPGRRYDAVALGRLQARRRSCPRAARARGEARCHQQLRLEPLAEAVKVANARLVEMLLDAGSNVEVPNQEGQTALMLAARAGSVDVAELLVRHGADVNAREKWRGQTALIWAVGRTLPRADAVSHRP